MTFTLSRFLLSDVVSLCGELPGTVASADTMEDAAAAVVRYLRESFVDPATGDPEIVLARCFQTVTVDALPADLREYVAGLPSPPAGDARCLTLLGSDGDLSEWCDRRRSAMYRAIPLPSADALSAAPLVTGLVERLDADLDTLADGRQGADTPAQGFDVFFVPHAVGDPRVPRQDFVQRHGVRSVLGFGGVLPEGEVFTVVLFTRTPVDPAVAEMFRTIAVAVKLALLPAVAKPLFGGGPSRQELAEEAGAARLRTLEQMLAVQQQTVASQAARLEDAVQQAESERKHAAVEVETTETLREIGTTLAADLTLDRVVQSATDAATRVTGAAFGAFFYNVEDSSGESYMLYTLAGAPREAFERFPMPGNTAVFEPTFRGDGPVRSDDITRDHRYGRNPPHHGTPPGHLPVCSYLAVPVVSRDGTVHGGLFFGHPQAAVFDERSERLAIGIAAQTAVALDNARLYERQRNLALELQRSLLQPRPLPVPEGIELAYEYLPSAGGADVGGDWFDVIPLAGGRIAFVVGDVMGRGVHAAAIMGQLRTAVRAYAVIDLPPSDLISRFNELVCEMSEDLIATCAYAVYDPSEQVLTLANAGHLPPALLRPGGAATLLDLQLGPPLGVAGGVYHEHDIAFPAGTRLVLFTDGLVEHRGRTVDHGLHELREWLSSAKGSLDLVCKEVISALLDPAAQDDDVTLLALGNTGTELLQETRHFDAAAHAPAQALAFAQGVLAGWATGLDPDPIVRVASALVSDAVAEAGGDVTLRLRQLSSGIYVEVLDRDRRLPGLSHPDVADEHHPAMQSLAQLPTRWGARQTRNGAVVWAEFSRGGSSVDEQCRTSRMGEGYAPR